MASYLQLFALLVIAVFLFWFGYSVLFRAGGGTKNSPFPGWGKRAGRRRDPGEGEISLAGTSPGAPRTCPVCSARLLRGEHVKSAVYPPGTDKSRLMYINGCVYCLEGRRRRQCPVCGAILRPGEILVARMFDKPGRSHVHVLGCSRCRGPQSSNS
jgi:hypothetical protein